VGTHKRQDVETSDVPHLLACAAAHCTARHINFTALRSQVFETLLEADVALGAYDLIARMSSKGAELKPPTIYRALRFLMRYGFVHRIESMNAYIACALPDEKPHNPGFMICRSCGLVQEVAFTLPCCELLSGDRLDFHVEKTVYEIKGVCKICFQSQKN
jgi:Fur family zinc uptake transcriptional regulator